MGPGEALALAWKLTGMVSPAWPEPCDGDTVTPGAPSPRFRMICHFMVPTGP